MVNREIRPLEYFALAGGLLAFGAMLLLLDQPPRWLLVSLVSLQCVYAMRFVVLGIRAGKAGRN